MRRRYKEATRRVKQLDRVLLFIPVTVATYRLGIHAWNSWCIAMLVILTMGVRGQDTSILQDNDGLSS